MTDLELDAILVTLRRTGRVHQAFGWSLTYFVKVGTGEREFTAQLAPFGRSSTRVDWLDLGRMVAALGYPEKNPPPTIETDPNGVHRWEWIAEPVL